MIKLNKSTRYALYAAVELAQAQAIDGDPVTAAAVARRYGLPAAVLAKVFQQLVRAGLAVGTRGSGGGYRLARRPAELTVLEVMEAFEPPLPNPPEPAQPDPGRSSLGRLFDEVDEQARCTFASITLETLVGRQRPRDQSATEAPAPRGSAGRPT